MGWGAVPSEQRAADQAAEVAAQRAQARAQMSPFEREAVALFRDIRETLSDVRDALKVLLDEPVCGPDCGLGVKPAGPQTNP